MIRNDMKRHRRFRRIGMTCDGVNLRQDGGEEGGFKHVGFALDQGHHAL